MGQNFKPRLSHIHYGQLATLSGMAFDAQDATVADSGLLKISPQKAPGAPGARNDSFRYIQIAQIAQMKLNLCNLWLVF